MEPEPAYDPKNSCGHLWSPAKLQRLPLARLLEMFTDLPPAGMDEMNGEYEAALLNQGSWFQNRFSSLGLELPLLHGRWLGKAFTPDGGAVSHGYNAFWNFGRVVRKYRMQTRVMPSRFDSGRSFTLLYSAYDNLCGRVNMVDEVRRVQPGLYLGVGTLGFTEKQRRKPLPFVLSGPVGPFVGSDRPENK